MTTAPPPPLPISVRIPGRARTKGSMKVIGRRANGTAKLAESVTGSSEWRSTVAEVLQRHLGAEFTPGGPVRPYAPIDTPVRVVLWVKLPRGRTRAHSAAPDQLRDGDLDKYQRNVGDALVDAGVLTDDSRIVEWQARKDWAETPEQAGALIEIHAADPQPLP
jgi:Holliday junction resolvase RusA-like endonuclease